MEFLCILLVVLAFFTVVGHGIWVGLAALFRVLSGTAPEPRQERRPERLPGHCLACQATMHERDLDCPSCGFKRFGPRAREVEEIDAAVRGIRGLLDSNVLDEPTGERLVTLLLARRRKILGQAEKAAVPVVAPGQIETVRVAPIPVASAPLTAVPLTPTPRQSVNESEILDVLPVEAELGSSSEVPSASAPVGAPVEPAAPKRSWADLLATFMEEKNILWGELVGGLLIVGCSLALVLTLWRNLQALPYFPFMLFTALTSALFAAGQYTLHHWKLTTTSRGLLLICLLLIPLNLLILADPSGRGGAKVPLLVELGVDLAALAGFAAIVYFAGKHLIGAGELPGPIDRRWLLALAIVGTAGSQLMGPHVLTPGVEGVPGNWLLLVSLASVCHLLACGAVLGGISVYGPANLKLSAGQAYAGFTFVGLATFTFCSSIGYLLTRLENPVLGLTPLATPLTLAGIPGVVLGILVVRKLAEEEARATKVVGTGVALVGLGLMFVGVALAWPAPWPLLGTLGLTASVLGILAVLARIPWLHAGAVPALGLTVLVGYHLITGAIPVKDNVDPSWGLYEQLTSAESGVLLALLAGALTGLAAGFARNEQADALGWGGLTVGIAALLLVTGHGLEAPWSAASVHALCGITGALASLRWRRANLATMSVLLLIPGALWALWASWPGQLAWWGVLVAGEGLALAVLGSWLLRCSLSELGQASQLVSLLGAALGLGLAIGSGSFATEPQHTWTASLVAMTLLVGALQQRSRWLFASFQVMTTVAVLCGVTAVANHWEWLHDGRWLQAYGLGLGLLSLGWQMGRRAAPGPLWEAVTPGIDQLTLGVVISGQFLLSLVSAWPGVLAEWNLLEATQIPSSLTALYGPLGWVLPGVLALALLGNLVRAAGEGEQTVQQTSLIGLALLWVSLSLHYAGWHTEDLAAGSAARWALGGCFLVGSLVVWSREQLDQMARHRGLVLASVKSKCYPLFAGVALAVVLLTGVVTGLGFAGEALAGPGPDSLFHKMGSMVNSIGPLLLVVLGLIGTAMREGWPGYALAGGVLTASSVMGGYALGVVQAGNSVDVDQGIFILLLGSISSSLAGLGWLLTRRWIGGGELLRVQCLLGLTLLGGLGLLTLPLLLVDHGWPGEQGFAMLGSPPAWYALLLAIVAAWWHAELQRPESRHAVAGWAVFLGGILGSCATRAYDTPVNWVSYHVLVAIWGLTAVVLTVVGSGLSAGMWRHRALQPTRKLRRWLVVLAGLLVLLGLRGAWDHAVFRPVPPGAVLAASLLLGAVALWFGRGGYAHASGWMFTLGVFLGWVVWGPDRVSVASLMIVLGLGISAIFWWTMDLPWPGVRRREIRWRLTSYPALATFVALVLLTGLTGLAVLKDGIGEPRLPLGPFGWGALGVVGMALALAVHAGKYRLGLPGLYVLSMTAAGMVLHALEPTPQQLSWQLPLALSVHGLVCSLVVHLWQNGMRKPGEASTSLQLEYPVLPDREYSWLVPAQLVVGLGVVVLSLNVALEQPSLLLRLTGPLAIGLLLPAAWWLGRALPAPRDEQMGLIGLVLVVLTLTGMTWAIPDPSGPMPWVVRNGWLLLVWTSVSAVGIEGLTGWPKGRKLALAVAGCSWVLFGVVITQMVPHFNLVTRRTGLDGLTIAAVALAGMGQIAMALRLALRGDPLNWPEERRRLYVYLVEVLLLLLFVHVRLNVPELFLGPLARFWTFIVLGMAYLGVGLGEWAARRGLHVLAVPLTRTGILLPLLPLLAFWARPPMVLLGLAEQHAPGLRPFLDYLDRLPWNFNAHALIWFMTSALYASLARARRSMGWALLAALAATFGFWALLMHAGISFLLHPQAWIIPLGLILLVAEHLHREELSAQLGQGLRYLGISLIYVASTADLFLNGLGNSMWLPIVLAFLCVAGVLAGILLRVKAFLFLGIGFLLVDLLTMIWYAAVDRAHTWLWWVTGIVLGVAILALVGLFEKRRQEVQRLLHELQRWN